MKIFKFFTFAVLSFSLSISCASAQTNRKKKVKTIIKTPAATQSPRKIRERKPPEFDTETGGAANVKTIAEGSDASVTTPFVFVARTADAFAQLQKLVKNLPLEKTDFNQTAIVAVFAGEKNTGGYSLAVEKSGDTISVKVAAPPKDAMVTQSLTMPFKVVLVEVAQENSLAIDLSSDFSSAMKNYRVSSGAFEFSGGITGRLKTFAADGTIKILTFGDYVTAIFNLTGKAGENRRTLNEIASGTLINGKINLTRVEAGDFIDRPHPFLTVAGSFSSDKLSLSFSPGKRDYVVNDGYAGGGKLVAVVSGW